MLATSCCRSSSEKPLKSGSTRISSNIGGRLVLDRHQLVPAAGEVVMILEIVGRFAHQKEPKSADLPSGQIITHVGVGMLARVERAAAVETEHAQLAIGIEALEL